MVCPFFEDPNYSIGKKDKSCEMVERNLLLKENMPMVDDSYADLAMMNSAFITKFNV